VARLSENAVAAGISTEEKRWFTLRVVQDAVRQSRSGG
jgi:hypothetical protein